MLQQTTILFSHSEARPRRETTSTNAVVLLNILLLPKKAENAGKLAHPYEVILWNSKPSRVQPKISATLLCDPALELDSIHRATLRAAITMIPALLDPPSYRPQPEKRSRCRCNSNSRKPCQTSFAWSYTSPQKLSFISARNAGNAR